MHPDVDPQVAFDVLTAIFTITVQRELIGAEATQRALVEIVEAMATRWCPG